MKTTTAALSMVLLAVAWQPAQAGDPCGAVLCLSNNTTAPHECRDYVDGYFSIREYHKRRGKKVYDPGGTAVKRYREVMDKCSGAEQKDKDRINAKFGMIKNSPFQFSDRSKDDNDSYNSDKEADAAYERELSSFKGTTTNTPQFGPLPTTKDGLLAEYNSVLAAWQTAWTASQTAYSALVECGRKMGGPGNCPELQQALLVNSTTADAYWDRATELYNAYSIMH